MRKCICGVEGGRPFTVAEHQLGLGDEFEYLECETCGSLRIADIPANFERYYPQNYYSFSRNPQGWRDRLQPLAMTIGLLVPFPALPVLHFHFAAIVQSMRISRGDRVLDVGSGVDGMATQLRAAGHRNALGVDPFIQADVHDKLGLAVKKAYLSEIESQWDVIAFNHSLEHINDPIGELSTAKSLLAPNGRIIVRIPVAAWAFQEYGPRWVQLDAPRHLFIPTERGFYLMAESLGLRLTKVLYDSTDFQFWASELYRRNINLVSVTPETYWQFNTHSERRRLMKRANKLNQQHLGDQAAFFLTFI